ncbi:hypothetical protein HOK51_04170 [Candidatus Woesearchaeota archaeon]|jgi:hypothetical protein|nr:hypothetical protein [Candidatus Woesearchaeota archaeon]MBT6519018.1 hypothetical protein [Candidatus Woesearchaeota archaeon]MBT7368783.1 hypothetical protein [Candidatus Woesearchaeota archaeon]
MNNLTKLLTLTMIGGLAFSGCKAKLTIDETPKKQEEVNQNQEAQEKQKQTPDSSAENSVGENAQEKSSKKKLISPPKQQKDKSKLEGILTTEGTITQVYPSHISYYMTTQKGYCCNHPIIWVTLRDNNQEYHQFMYPNTAGLRLGSAKIKYEPLETGEFDQLDFIKKYVAPVKLINKVGQCNKNKKSRRYGTVTKATGIIVENGVSYEF